MARPLEFSGSTVDKAAAAASKKLNVPQEKLKYKVLSYGSSGIFGLVGAKKAKIKVDLPSEPAGKKKKSAVARIKERLKGHSRQKDGPAESNRNGAKRSEKLAAGSGSDPNGAAEKNELVQIGYRLLNRITETVAGNAEIHTEVQSDRLIYRIESTEAAVLIGKRGQTLEAIQYLTEKVINKNSDKRMSVLVDVEGYLEKRQQNLASLASRMAEKAVRTSKPVTIGQMSAYERRIVHLTLKGDHRVRTQSRGDGYLRKLIIFPAKKGNKKKGDRS